MTDSSTLQIVVDALADIAPEVDAATLDHDIDLREQVDLDSMDFLNLMEAIAAATGVEVPERDYPLVSTLAGLTAYIEARATQPR